MDPRSTITTIVFTDIEGSSRLWETEPERMRRALAAHDALVRTAVERNGGAVVKMTGDGVCASFDDPLDALNAAVALQRSLADASATGGLALPVRCGMHAGAVERRDGDLFGNPVNRAARIMSAAHGGQTLASQAVVDLVRDRLGNDVSMRALGVVRLRDLANPEALFQLDHPALRDRFPALRSLAATPNNLPLQATSFVGRVAELSQAKALLAGARLLTLCGSGGIGKTRLSLELGAALLNDFPDGVWLVELAALSDRRLVAQAVGSVLAVKEDAGRPVIEALARHVRALRTLIILDNCEHVIEACAEVCDHLLKAGPALRIVTSSRERLNIPGETVFAMPALAVPDVANTQTLDALRQYESVELFCARASATSSSFRPSDDQGDAIAEICRRLDGIPLAIELAAARVRSISVEEIASRLDDRFALLTSGSRTALPRQRTLRALIDWSYDSLRATEQTMFRRLSVFAGDWTLEAAEAVCAAGEVSGVDVLDLVAAMVEKSLVSLDAHTGRYAMLETIREYAKEQLRDSGEEASVRSQHLAFYLALAETARPLLAGPQQTHWLDQLDFERENLLEANAWCDRAEQGADLGLRLVTAVKPYWVIRGFLALGLAATLEALARSERHGRTQARAQALSNAGQLEFVMGRYADAQTHLEESLSIAREIGDRTRVARVLQPLGAVCIAHGDLAAGRRHSQEALDLARELGNKRELAAALNALAQLHRMERDLKAAETYYQQALALGRELGDDEIVAVGLLNLAMVAIGDRRSERAPKMLLEVLDIAGRTGSRPAGQSALEVCAGLAALEQDWLRAARFYGMAEGLSRRTGIRRDAADDAFLKPLMVAAKTALGSPQYDSAETGGDALPNEAAVVEARKWLLDPHPALSRTREREP